MIRLLALALAALYLIPQRWRRWRLLSYRKSELGDYCMFDAEELVGATDHALYFKVEEQHERS